MSIEIRDLKHVYGEGTAFRKEALGQVNLTINQGEFVGIIGHTGSGKSTLIQHLNGLLKPSEGQVVIDGQVLHTKDVDMREIRQSVGLVFQYPEHQLFEMTIYKDVAFGPQNMGLTEEEIDKRVKKALSIVGINENEYEVSPFELSGGQKRRVAIAGVLAMEPDILVLDEPTAGLDPKGRDDILNEVKKLHRELGITVILVSHSMEDIARYVDRVVVMDGGGIVLDGTPRTVFQNVEKLETMGLAVPQITYIVSALRDRGFDLPQDIITVEEAKEALVKILKDQR